VIILKIIGIVAAALVVLCLLLLAVPIDFVVRRNEREGLRLYLRVCRIPFKLNGKPKKQKKKKKKEGKFTALLKRTFGIKHAEEAPAEKQGSAAASPALQEIVSTVMGLVREVLNTVKKCKVLRCRFRVVCGGEDAALDYGTACAIVYPLAGWLEGQLNVGRRGMDLQLGWDYDRPKATYEVDFILRIRVFRVLLTLYRMAMRKTEE